MLPARSVDLAFRKMASQDFNEFFRGVEPQLLPGIYNLDPAYELAVRRVRSRPQTNYKCSTHIRRDYKGVGLEG